MFDPSVCPQLSVRVFVTGHPFLFTDRASFACPRISMDSAESSDAIVSSDKSRRKGAVTLSLCGKVPIKRSILLK